MFNSKAESVALTRTLAMAHIDHLDVCGHYTNYVNVDTTKLSAFNSHFRLRTLARFWGGLNYHRSSATGEGHAAEHSWCQLFTTLISGLYIF